MPNPFIKTPPQSATTTQSEVKAKNRDVSMMQDAPLSFFQSRRLKKASDTARVEQGIADIQAVKTEAIATAVLNASLQGSTVRTALSRKHGENLSAEISAIGDSHTAVVLTQRESRVSASMANLLERNAEIKEVRQRLAKGEISEQDAEDMINGIVQLHIEAETRIDGMYTTTSNATDSVFKAGMAPIKHHLS